MSRVVGVAGQDFTVEDVRGEFPDEIEIHPLHEPIDAEIQVPGSKSVTNRALIAAALADGPSTIQNPLISDDSYWLLDSLTRIGIPTNTDQNTNSIHIRGQRGIIPKSDVELFVGNAGTVARFLPPVLALGDGPYRVDGVPRMRERPVEDLVEALWTLGVGIEYEIEAGKFPLVVRGGGIRGGVSRVSGDKSSQFLSGILLVAPYASEKIELHVETTRQGLPYVGITVDVMREFGIDVGVSEDYRSFVVEPGFYTGRDYFVEPDASGASYFMAAAAVTGGRIRIPGLGFGSPQGDLRFAEVCEAMGCEVEVALDHVEVRGPEELKGIEVDMNAFSDTMITLAAIAPFASSPTTIKNIGHTRHQETDRISAVATELGKLGIQVEEGPDSLHITPGPISPGKVETYGDHRLAMAFAVSGLATPGIRIQNPGVVTKTFPDYFERLKSLG